MSDQPVVILQTTVQRFRPMGLTETLPLGWDYSYY